MKTWLALLALAACHHHETRETPEAAPALTVTPIIAPRDGGISPAQLAEILANGGEDDEPGAAGEGGATCPLPIHPDYCRHRCRNFAARTFSMHARRMSPSRRAGKGKCGAYLVFAEEQRAEDGGVGGSLVEYFDATTNEIVAAEDSRRKPCGDFGKVPKCKIDIDWGPVKP